VSHEGSTIDPAGLLEAVEQAPDGVLITNSQGIIQFVNPAFTAMTGFSREEAIGQKPHLLKSGCHTELFYKDLWNTILSGRTWAGEVTNRRKDGSLYTEEIRIAPVRDSKGVPTRFIAILHDVTKKRATADKQALLAEIVEDSKDSIIACTPTGVILAFNGTAEKTFGYSANEVIGQKVSILVPKDRIAALEQVMQRILQGISVSGYEGWCLTKNGIRFPVSGTGSLITNSTGEVVGISNILRDNTNDVHRRILGAAGDGIYGLDADGLTTFVNPAAAAMLGYTSDELMGKSQHAMIHHSFPDGSPAPRESCLIYQALHDGLVHYCDSEVFWKKDGTSLPIAYTSTPIIRNGKPDGAVVVFQEISERKRRERAMLESSKLEAIGTLAAGIAHDFNNILASIVSFAELTAEDLTDGSDAQRNVRRIINGCFRARSLVNRMLDFARERPGKPVQVNIAFQVREALALLRASLPPSIQLSFASGMAGTTTILADPTQIMQIVMNLCINAAQAMDNHGIIGIRIDAADAIADAPPQQRGGICITVADTGSGMTPAVMERIFDPFFTTKAPGEGSGLGLSVVYGIVKTLGGVIQVSSSAVLPSTGTQFHVFLPALLAASAG
jgi:PAS domain S-box-containing protein